MNSEERKPQESEEEQQEALSAYEALAKKTRELLSEAKEKVSADTIKEAIDKSVAEMRSLGKHTEEALEKANVALKKDMASTAEKVGPAWEKSKQKTRHFFDIWSDRGTVFTGQVASAVGGWLEKVGEKLGHGTYHAGEMTYGGEFECVSCGEKMTMEKSGFIFPCPKCMQTEYRRL